MLEKFSNVFKTTGRIEDEYDIKLKVKAESILSEGFKNIERLIRSFGGQSFNHGLYRIHTFSSSLYWTNLTTSYFRKYKGKVYSFGYDWLGRHFLLDCLAYLKGKDLIYIFDPAEGRAYEIPLSIEQFHEEELIEYTNEALEKETFEEWRNKNDSIDLAFKDCVGYKTPLFLGGEDIIANYEIIDLDVHWEISYQLYNKTRNLPEGSIIKNVTIEDPIENKKGLN